MEIPNYPGMRGPEELVGEYYLNEGARIVSSRQVKLYIRDDGHTQLRDCKTGKFISAKSLLDRL